MSKIIAEMQDVSFSFTVKFGASLSLKDSIISIFGNNSLDLQIKAIENLSLSISSGEVLAVVGENGSGKSTLLKILAGIVRPSSGRVVVKGRIATVIELGDYFNPELSGLENIIYLGTLLGRHSSEMEQRANSIALWGGIQDAINQPVRTYSSGMIAKLAMAIATDLRPDLLLLDEVLSVSDSSFREKATKRIEEFIDSGTAVVLVTHDYSFAREIAHKALWLDSGTIIGYGRANLIIDSFLNA